MRKSFLSAVVVSAVLALAGCGGSSESASADSNTGQCTEFAAAYNSLASLVTAGPTSAEIDQWTAAKSESTQRFATANATASGAVHESLTTLVNALPSDTLELSEPDSESGKALIANADAVAAACEADGTTIALDEFPVPTF